MYDATGKLPPGVLKGNFFQFGAFDQCIEIEDVGNDTKSLTGKYCLGSLSIPNEYIRQLESLPSDMEVPSEMKFSVCFPNSCSGSDIAKLAKGIGLNLTVHEADCQTKATQPKITPGGYTTLALLVLILILIILSTTYELTCAGKQHWALKSFSLRTNGKLIFDVVGSDHNKITTCFYGLRVLAMLDVIMIHVYCLRFMTPIMNSYSTYYWEHDLQGIVIIHSRLAMEIFFFISGYLALCNFWQKASRGNKFNICAHYIGRYLRLTPSVVVILLIQLTWFKNVGSGPLWNQVDGMVAPCVSNWWAYLLYIQNWMPEMCLPGTWYLSIDFQLFILSPILLIPLKRWPKRTLIAAICLTVLSCLSTFLLAWTMKIHVHLWKFTYNYSKYVYYFTPTWATTWLFGFIFSYIIFVNNKEKKVSAKNKRLKLVLLTASIIVIIASLFGAYHIHNSEYNRLEQSVYIALIRPTFLLALGSIVYCCYTGHGGIVNRFLSHPFFEVVSRLSYNMYLFHPFVIYYSTLSIRVAPFVTSYSYSVSDFAGCVFLTFFLSLVASLTVELPAQHFVNALMNYTKQKNV
ncbi:nose resistant to fluoxetine protein 6-like [Photinus pyralis]|nr:nose resistant to fluoxetine protein 6-like [Photinus pyralis]